MTTNRLAKSDAAKPKRTQQEICDDANARMLADPHGRRDIRWAVRNERAVLEWSRPAQGSMPQ